MRRAFALLLVLGGFLVACQIIAGIERVEKEDSPPDVVAEPPPTPPPPPPPPAIPDPCAHVLPPGPPALDDDPSAIVGDAANGDAFGEIYFALRKVVLSSPPGAPQIGYDLDDVCTCDTRAGSKHDGGSSCVRTDPPCDGDGGVDNGLVDVIAKSAGLIDIDQAANVQSRIDRGQQNALILITKYNGQANDKDIGVGLLTSEGILADDPDSGAPPTQPGCPTSTLVDGFWTPGWCGADRWSVSVDTVDQSGSRFQPKIIGAGYVSNYTFVTSFQSNATIPFGGSQISLGSPLATGRLVPLDANQLPIDVTKKPVPAATFWRIEDGVLAGRVALTQILAAIGSGASPGRDGGSDHLCSSELFTSLVKPALCPAADVNMTETLDFDPKAPCDAISTALSFRADPVLLDRFVTPAVDPNECLPSQDGTHPEGVPGVTYTCP
jgi:hypothetical protein